MEANRGVDGSGLPARRRMARVRGRRESRRSSDAWGVRCASVARTVVTAARTDGVGVSAPFVLRCARSALALGPRRSPLSLVGKGG